jgi:hypothetical protein
VNLPRDPQFDRKAARILDLYAGRWQRRPLRPSDIVLSSDENTSIQARRRRHAETPPGPDRPRRVEHTYGRTGALQYLAAWDVRRRTVLGRCEAKTGIAPFGRLVDQIRAAPEYRDAWRSFVVVENGSSHRGEASVERPKPRDPRLVLVHTPVHASWLNQVEVCFSLLQRKVLTPNDNPNLEAFRVRLPLYEELTNGDPRPFCWNFTRKKLYEWLKRAKPHFSSSPGDRKGGDRNHDVICETDQLANWHQSVLRGRLRVAVGKNVLNSHQAPWNQRAFGLMAESRSAL